MQQESKLMEMLTGYAAAHQHPVNIAIHLIGIPVIMFGAFVVLSWATFEISDFGPLKEFSVNFAQIAVICLFIFYLSLDWIFALVFLCVALPIALIAGRIGAAPPAVSGTIAAIAFFGGYLAQFVGHAVEKSAPVILRHPLQANLAAPFFTIVEIFNLLGLRADLFQQVQAGVAERQKESRQSV